MLGEIARGGMGAVLRGRDEDLGRELAIKVLLEHHQDDAAFRRRFLEEAQIGGQLQHPGIVPIYELGTFADSRPYFAMKLVHGETLSALLAARPDPADGLPRFLGIFEQVSQTVAYGRAGPGRRASRRLRAGVDSLRDPHGPASLHRRHRMECSRACRASRPGRRALRALNNCGEEPELISAGSDSYV